MFWEVLIITKFNYVIKYQPEYSFKQFADEVLDARCTKDVDDDYNLIADTMKLFRNSASGETITN